MRKLLVCSLFVVVAACAVPVIATPITLVNADFETGTAVDGIWNGMAGWTGPAGSFGGEELNRPGGGLYSAAVCAEHSRALRLDSWYAVDFVKQTVADTYVAGNTYTFSIDIGVGPNYYGGGDLAAGGDLILQSFDGSTYTTLATQNSVNYVGDTFERFSVSYVATAGDAGKQIVVGVNKTEVPQWIYTVDYDNAALEVVPEPATMSLLAIGGLAALIRRRK